MNKDVQIELPLFCLRVRLASVPAPIRVSQTTPPKFKFAPLTVGCIAEETISIDPFIGELTIEAHLDLPGSGPLGALKSSRRTAGAGIVSGGGAFVVVQFQEPVNGLLP